MKLPFTIAVDFDNTIAYSCWPNIDGLMPNAKECINDLYDSGFKIIIWTCREGSALDSAKQFLSDSDIRYHHINENCPERTALFDSDSRKIGADLYVDDKSTHGIIPWMEVVRIAKLTLLLHEAGFHVGQRVQYGEHVVQICGIDSALYEGDVPVLYIRVQTEQGRIHSVKVSDLELL